MRRLLALVLVAVTAPAAWAQMPPSISKPIEMAKKNANAASQAVRTAEQPGSQATAPKPAQSAAPAPAKGKPAAAVQATPSRAAPAARSAAADARSAAAQDSGKITFDREVFTYVVEGRRDPFASPIETGEIRPLLADLKVTGIIYDPHGRNSVAVMRDMSTQEQYRVKTGNMLGRAKVAQIKPQEVVMTIDEYGFSRQETLTLSVQKTQQTKRTP
jgi:hypothetical protein